MTDAGSTAKADQVMTSLVQAIDGLVVRLSYTQTSPQASYGALVIQPSAALSSVERECELAADESKSVVRHARQCALDTDEVAQHTAQGKLPRGWR